MTRPADNTPSGWVSNTQDSSSAVWTVCIGGVATAEPQQESRPRRPDCGYFSSTRSPPADARLWWSMTTCFCPSAVNGRRTHAGVDRQPRAGQPGGPPLTSTQGQPWLQEPCRSGHRRHRRARRRQVRPSRGHRRPLCEGQTRPDLPVRRNRRHQLLALRSGASSGWSFGG
jgi:hypothetical protein